jgi:hypothetical protein
MVFSQDDDYEDEEERNLNLSDGRMRGSCPTRRAKKL